MAFTDMAKTPEEIQEEVSPLSTEVNKYPYGLRIRLTKFELDKLDVDYSDWKVGDVFHLHALAKVTSISENETEGDHNCCVEMQITHLAGTESEDEENEDADEEMSDEDGHSLEKHGYVRA